MVAGAADLLSRRGMHGTSLREVVRHTDTPRGSIGYHFPGGKAQLIEAAVQLSQQEISAILESLLQQRGAVAGVREAFRLRGASLLDSRYEAGCPVLVVAVERYTDDAKAAPDAGTQQQLLDAANQAFCAPHPRLRARSGWRRWRCPPWKARSRCAARRSVCRRWRMWGMRWLY